MTREPNKTIGTWRVLPVVPELAYASPTAARPRTRSGFGLASLLLGCVLAVGVTTAALHAIPWTSQDGDRVAVAALPVSVVGVGFGIVGTVRRSKRRLPPAWWGSSSTSAWARGLRYCGSSPTCRREPAAQPAV